MSDGAVFPADLMLFAKMRSRPLLLGVFPRNIPVTRNRKFVAWGRES